MKNKHFLFLSVLLMTLLTLSFYVVYQFYKEKHDLSFRCAQARLNTSLMTLEDNNDSNNTKLINTQVLFMESALISVIYYYRDWPELLSDHEKSQLKKSVERIEVLVAEGKLDFLSRPDLADETKAFIEEGIAAIKSGSSSQ